jgi:hypothetical protein
LGFAAFVTFPAVAYEHDLIVLTRRPYRLDVRVVLALAVEIGIWSTWPGRSARVKGVSTFSTTGAWTGAVLQTLVTHQRAGRKPAAEDLEPIARAEHEPATGQELRKSLHHGRPAGHRTGAEIVAVGEATGQDDAVEAVEISIPMPDVLDRLPDDFRDDVMEVAVAPCAGEDDDTESHEGGVLLSVCRVRWRNVAGFRTCSDGAALGPPRRWRSLEDRVGEQAPAHLVTRLRACAAWRVPDSISLPTRSPCASAKQPSAAPRALTSMIPGLSRTRTRTFTPDPTKTASTLRTYQPGSKHAFQISRAERR